MLPHRLLALGMYIFNIKSTSNQNIIIWNKKTKTKKMKSGFVWLRLVTQTLTRFSLFSVMLFLNKMFEKPCSYHYIYIAKKCNCLSMFHFCQYFSFGFSKKKKVCEKGAKCRQYFFKEKKWVILHFSCFCFFYVLGCTDVLLKQGCIKHCDIVFSINSQLRMCELFVWVHSYLWCYIKMVTGFLFQWG